MLVSPLKENFVVRLHVVGQHRSILHVTDLVRPAIRRHVAHVAVKLYLHLRLLVLLFFEVRVPPLEVER